MLKHNVRHSCLAALVIVAAIAFSLILYKYQSPGFTGIGYDREVFRYIGMVVHQGGVPYRDALDHKPPLIYFVASLNPSSGPWFFYWTLAILSIALAITAFLLLAAESLWAASGALAVFLVVTTSPFFVEGGGLTRQITAPLVFLIGAIYYSSKIHITNKAWMTGIVSGCIFQTQQNELLLAIPFIVGLVIQAKEDIRVGIVLRLISGGVLALLPVVVYFVYVDSFGEFVKQSILINTSVYIESKSFSEKIIETWYSLWDYHLVPIFVAAIVMALYHLPKRPRVMAIPITLLFLSFMDIAISGKHFGHYHLSLAPAFAVAVWTILVAFGEIRELRHLAGVAALLVLYLIYPFLVFAGEQVKALSAAPALEEMHYQLQAGVIENAIKDVYGQRGQFYSLNRPGLLAVNADMKIIAPTRFIYQHFWGNPNFEKMFGHQDQIVDALEQYQTKYLATCNGGKKVVPALDDYIHQHYAIYVQQVSVGCDLLKRSK